MICVDAGGGDRLALAVLAQYRMATTEQMHRVITPEVRIEQSRRRLARLRTEGLVDRIICRRPDGGGCGSPPRTACGSPASGLRCAGVGSPGLCSIRPRCG
ncbi:replication-relaxation family protein [Streptomyces sp. DH17]|nr:replication-relaxation family protein [Streptomyces sp. DH17]